MPHRLEKLLTWQALYSERINRTVLFIFLVTVIYSYYGFVYPRLVQEKTVRYQQARDDLRVLRLQFGELQRRYQQLGRTLNQQAGVCNPLVILKDQIASSLHHPTPSGPESSALFKLERSIDILTHLYNELRNTGVGSPVIDVSQRGQGALSDLPDGIIPADTRLTNLLQLDEVISTLKTISVSPLDSVLAEQARTASIPTGACVIDIQDRLTLNVPIFRELAEYLPPESGRLKFDGLAGLRSYESIIRFVGAPLTIDTIADLQQLERYVAGMSEKAAAEVQNPYQLPIVNIGIERSAILVAGPFALMMLFHTLAMYMRKSRAIISELTKEGVGGFTVEDFLNHDPGMLHPNNGFTISPSDGPSVLLTLHCVFSTVARFSLVLHPLVVGLVVFWAFHLGPAPVYSHSWRTALSLTGILCCAVSLSEAVHITYFLRSESRRPVIAPVNSLQPTEQGETK